MKVVESKDNLVQNIGLKSLLDALSKSMAIESLELDGMQIGNEEALLLQEFIRNKECFLHGLVIK